MVIVRVPNRFYRGVIADVQFENGEGRFENEEVARKIATQFGFAVVEEKTEAAEAVEVVETKVEKPKRTRKKVSAE